MSFPKELLRRDDTAICFCVAAFGGRQDVVYLRDAGLTRVVCVDTDSEKLKAMAPKFPKSWTWSDVSMFVILEQTRDCPEAQRCDVLTCDPWTGQMSDRCIDSLRELLGLTRRVLVLGMGKGQVDRAMTEFAVLGFVPRVIERSETAVWVVVDREAK